MIRSAFFVKGLFPLALLLMFSCNTGKRTVETKTTEITTLYYENEWCQAFKNLVVQHMLVEILGKDFEESCLKYDGSGPANVRILGDSTYILITKKVSDYYLQNSELSVELLRKYDLYMVSFDYRMSAQLDSITGEYYKQRFEVKSK